MALGKLRSDPVAGIRGPVGAAGLPRGHRAQRLCSFYVAGTAESRAPAEVMDEQAALEVVHSHTNTVGGWVTCIRDAGTTRGNTAAMFNIVLASMAKCAPPCRLLSLSLLPPKSAFSSHHSFLWKPSAEDPLTLLSFGCGLCESNSASGCSQSRCGIDAVRDWGSGAHAQDRLLETVEAPFAGGTQNHLVISLHGGSVCLCEQRLVTCLCLSVAAFLYTKMVLCFGAAICLSVGICGVLSSAPGLASGMVVGCAKRCSSQ